MWKTRTGHTGVEVEGLADSEALRAMWGGRRLLFRIGEEEGYEHDMWDLLTDVADGGKMEPSLSLCIPPTKQKIRIDQAIQPNTKVRRCHSRK
jgi:hypothetical protein